MAPDLRPAKHNLELALRKLEREQPREPPRQQGPEDSPAGEQGDPPEDGGSEPDEGESGRGEGASDTLPPGFEQQEDMTAEQAAALLAAIDDLERRQRKLQATEAAADPRRGRKEKDW
jgi:hypothetical protein